ncbi:MAG: helix-turn-helix domain-containing protein [Bdellovibrionales bacterium]
MRDKQSSITAAQIRGACALLDWSQEDLAQATKLSVATIRKLEQGNISPRGKTNQLIRDAVESARLEFIEPQGVRLRPDGVDIYEGESGVQRFFDDVYHTGLNGEEIVQVWPTYHHFNRVIGEYRAKHVERMRQVKDQIKVSCILTESSDVKVYEYCSYRFLSSHYVDCVPFYVYGDKYAIVSFPPDTHIKIIVVESRAAANAFRKQFYSMWDKATPLHPSLNKPTANVRAIDRPKKKRVK